MLHPTRRTRLRVAGIELVVLSVVLVAGPWLVNTLDSGSGIYLYPYYVVISPFLVFGPAVCGLVLLLCSFFVSSRS